MRKPEKKMLERFGSRSARSMVFITKSTGIRLSPTSMRDPGAIWYRLLINIVNIKDELNL